MLNIFNPSGEPFAAQTQRLTARTQFGGGDIFEIAGIAASVEPGDTDGWIRAWTALADTALQEAEAARSAQHTVTAVTRFFHASSYYQQSDVFTPGGDPRRAEAFRKSQASFRRASELLGPARIRVVQVRCGNEVYDGYFCLPDRIPGVRVPTVLFIGGLDAYSEETYFSGRGLLDRGMAMLLLDMPGRGSSIYLKNIPSRADYEVPVKAAFDWLAEQPEVDPERMGIGGISMAGYYAPRAAAFDKRVKALACWGAIMNVIDDLYDFHKRSHQQFQWITGSPDEATTRATLRDFDLSAVASQITCPTFIIHGGRDIISSVDGAKKLFAAIGSTDKQLRIFDGPGAGHCSYDDWRHAVPLLFDWLHDVLTGVAVVPLESVRV